jgi:hypothetical protein
MSHGGITVTSPSTGATWYKDVSYTISWSVSGGLITWNNFGIYLLKNGATEATIAYPVSGASRSYSYTPSNSLDTASDYQIQIVGNYDEVGN